MENNFKEILPYLYKDYEKNRKATHKIIDLCYKVLRQKVKLEGKPKEFIFMLSRDRNDFIYQFGEIYKSCDMEKSMLNISFQKTWNLFCIIDILYAWIHFFQRKKLLSHINKNMSPITMRDWLFISLMYAEYEMYRNALTKFDFSSSKFLVVYGEWLPEVAAIIYVKKLGITTIVNIQSIYALFADSKVFPQYGQIAFTWGQKDKDYLNELRPSLHTYVVGCPFIHKLKEIATTNSIGLVLSGNAAHKFNQTLIDIAEQYAINHAGMNVLIRPHPSDTITNYRINKDISKLEFNCDKAEIILLHKTTMFATYMIQGKKVYAYDTGNKENNLSIDPRFFFTDTNSLEKAISYNSNYDTLSYASHYISCIDDESVAVYKKLFHTLHLESNLNLYKCIN